MSKAAQALVTVGSISSLFDERDLGFSDAVLISGMDPRQLRNSLDRGSALVGEKLRIGRWAFSRRDCLALMIAQRLNEKVGIPIGLAMRAGREISDHFDLFIDELPKLVSDAASSPSFILLFFEQGELRVRNVVGGSEDRGSEWQDAHIRLYPIFLLRELFDNDALAREADADHGSE